MDNPFTLDFIPYGCLCGFVGGLPLLVGWLAWDMRTRKDKETGE